MYSDGNMDPMGVMNSVSVLKTMGIVKQLESLWRHVTLGR